jgi:hypothetical protein
VATLLGGPEFEGGQETVGMALVTLAGKHPDVDDLGDTAAERPAQTTDPVSDFVGKHQMALLDGVVRRPSSYRSVRSFSQAANSSPSSISLIVSCRSSCTIAS